MYAYGVAVGVRRTRFGDESTELGVGQRCAGTGDARDDEREGTAGPTAGALLPLATGPARAKIPAPIIAPSPIAVSCQSPILRCSSAGESSSLIGLRRKTPVVRGVSGFGVRLFLVISHSVRLCVAPGGPGVAEIALRFGRSLGMSTRSLLGRPGC